MKFIGKWLPLLRFGGSSEYWKSRYRLGGDSGPGSGGRPARYKAQILNDFVASHGIADVIEFGSGDGRQLELARYPKYTGYDISADAVAMCRDKFAGDETKRFALLDDYCGERAELALSLDVIFHLVEDQVYDLYLERLFAAGRKYVIVYSTAMSGPGSTLRHVRHRPVDSDIAQRFPEFTRMDEAETALPPPVERGEGGWTRFFIFKRST